MLDRKFPINIWQKNDFGRWIFQSIDWKDTVKKPTHEQRKLAQVQTIHTALHYSVYAFTHYLVHSLFGWELGQLVYISKKGI